MKSRREGRERRRAGEREERGEEQEREKRVMKCRREMKRRRRCWELALSWCQNECVLSVKRAGVFTARRLSGETGHVGGLRN